jgi:hypothetical protein
MRSSGKLAVRGNPKASEMCTRQVVALVDLTSDSHKVDTLGHHAVSQFNAVARCGRGGRGDLDQARVFSPPPLADAPPCPAASANHPG